MSWSGGKDSCLALYEIQKSPYYRVAALLTTMTRDYDRISMHGVRRVLLEQQAANPEFGLFGFYSGVTNTAVLVEHEYNEGGAKRVEAFLRSYQQ